MQKNGEWTNWVRMVICAAESLILFLSYILSFLIRFQSRYIPRQNGMAFQQLVPWIILIFIVFNLLSGIYVLYNKTKGDLLFITIITQGLLAGVTMVLSFVSRSFAFPRSVILIEFLVSVLLLYLFRWLIFTVYRRYSSTKRIMIVGEQSKVYAAVYNFQSSKSARHIVTHVVTSNYYENVSHHLDDIDIVYLASAIDENEKLNIYSLLMREGKKLFLNSQFENLVMVSPNIMNFEDESIIETSDFRIPSDQALIKRVFDIVVSLLMIILTSPIMLLTALAIKLTSKGPVFYRQVRITLGEQEFDILKFRSMYTDSEQKTGPIIARAHDDRITPVGRFIRAVRIDELPQLFNILKGDMSLIGPRPERPFFVDQFEKENPYYYLRHSVKAGLTGYAQVYGKYATDFNSKLNFDLIYIKTYSLIHDLKIMLQTVKILFEKVSSSGVDEENPHIVTEADIKGMGIKIID